MSLTVSNECFTAKCNEYGLIKPKTFDDEKIINSIYIKDSPKEPYEICDNKKIIINPKFVK